MIDVFMSVGRASRPSQEQFITAVEDLLPTEGLNCRAVGRSDFSSKQPLRHVQELMHLCRGTVIVAFERLYVAEGEERRGSQQAEPVRQEILPTVWNQIEAAMAYLLNQPLLVIVEEGSRNEGLLEAGYDWCVLKMKIDAASVNSREFRGVFSDWVKRVRDYHEKIEKTRKELPPEFDLSQIKIRQFLSLMTPGQFWKTAVAFASLIALAYSIGFFMAKYVLR